MITVNIDIKNRLINSQVGEVFEFKIVDHAINKVTQNVKIQVKIRRKEKLPNEFKRAVLYQ